MKTANLGFNFFPKSPNLEIKLPEIKDSVQEFTSENIILLEKKDLSFDVKAAAYSG